MLTDEEVKKHKSGWRPPSTVHCSQRMSVLNSLATIEQCLALLWKDMLQAESLLVYLSTQRQPTYLQDCMSVWGVAFYRDGHNAEAQNLNHRCASIPVGPRHTLQDRMTVCLWRAAREQLN